MPQKRCFHFHGMCNFQLSPQNNENENKKIFEIGQVNGYPANQIQKEA
jgi:hypothetical protein